MFRKTALALSSRLMTAWLCFARATGRDDDRYQENADQTHPTPLPAKRCSFNIALPATAQTEGKRTSRLAFEG